QAAILRAEGLKAAAILQAEGERQAQLLRAQGFAAALQNIDNEARDVTANTMALQYLETLQSVGSSMSTKFVVPMEMTTLMQQVMSSMQSRNNTPTTADDGRSVNGA